MNLSEKVLPRSALLRLVRARCNASEIAAAYGLDELEVERRMRHLAITVQRRTEGELRRRQARLPLQVAA